MSNSSDVNLHKITPQDIDYPVIKTTTALPRDSVLKTGLTPAETTRDGFESLSPEYQKKAERMMSVNADERKPQLDIFDPKDFVQVESNPEIPGNPAGRINRLGESELTYAIERELKTPPQNIKPFMEAGQEQVSTKMNDIRSNSSFNNFA